MNHTVYVYPDDLENFYRILIPAIDRKVVIANIPTVSQFYNPSVFSLETIVLFDLAIDTDHPESSILLLKISQYSLKQEV
jgi:hypothetical protein